MEADYYELLCKCLNKLHASGEQTIQRNEIKNQLQKADCNRIENDRNQQSAACGLKIENNSKWIRPNIETDDESGVRNQRFY